MLVVLRGQKLTYHPICRSECIIILSTSSIFTFHDYLHNNVKCGADGMYCVPPSMALGICLLSLERKINHSTKTEEARTQSQNTKNILLFNWPNVLVRMNVRKCKKFQKNLNIIFTERKLNFALILLL